MHFVRGRWITGETVRGETRKLVDKKHITGFVEPNALVWARCYRNNILKGRRACLFFVQDFLKGTSAEKQWRRLLRIVEFGEMEGPKRILGQQGSHWTRTLLIGMNTMDYLTSNCKSGLCLLSNSITMVNVEVN